MYLTLENADRLAIIEEHALTKIKHAVVYDAPEAASAYLSFYESLLTFIDRCDIELREVTPVETQEESE